MNAGTIVAATSYGLVVAGPTLLNTGLMEAVASGVLHVTSDVVDNAGTIGAAADTEVIVGGAITGAGELALGAQALMMLEGSVASGQTVEFEGPSTLRLYDAPGFAASLAGLVDGVTIDLPDLTIFEASLTPSALDIEVADNSEFGFLAFPVLGGDAGESLIVQPDGATVTRWWCMAAPRRSRASAPAPGLRPRRASARWRRWRSATRC